MLTSGLIAQTMRWSLLRKRLKHHRYDLHCFHHKNTLTVSSQTVSQIKEHIDYSRSKNFKLPDYYLKTKTSNALPPAPATADLPEAKMSIRGVAVIALLDTGAMVSIIPIHNYAKSPTKPGPTLKILCPSLLLLLLFFTLTVKCENWTEAAVKFQIMRRPTM